MSGKDDSSKGGRPRPASSAAKERSAAALRENLQRRKAQARAQETRPGERGDAANDPGEAPG